MPEEKNEIPAIVFIDPPSVSPHDQSEKITEQRKLLYFKYCKTAIFYLMFVAMGSIISMPGPTLLDLAKMVNVGPDKIGVIFTLRSAGFLVGAFAGGILLDYFRMKIPTLVAFALVMSIMTLSIPFCKVLYQLQILIFFLGVSIGGLNNGVNVCLLNVWGRKADSYFLALHFSFGVGAFLGPVIAGPFLEVEQRGDATSTTTTTIAPKVYPPRHIPKVFTAYAIVSGLAFFMAFLLAAFSLITRKSLQKLTITENKEEKLLSEKSNAVLTAIILIVAAAATFSDISIEVGFSSMILTYAVEGKMQLEKRRASHLSSVFWGAYMLTRFICIFVATKVRSEYFIAFDVVTLVISGLILSLRGTLFEPALWVGTALAGCGVATLFPSTVSWVGRYIRITFKVGSLFFIMGSISEMTWPVLLASYVKIVPDLLYFYFLVVSAVCFILYFALSIVFSQKRELQFTGGYDAESVCHYYGLVGQIQTANDRNGSSDEETGTSSSPKGSDGLDSPSTSKGKDSADLQILKTIDSSYASNTTTGVSKHTSVTQSSCEELDESLKKEES